MTTNHLESQTEAELITSFKAAGEKLIALMKDEEFKTKLTLDDSFPLFRALPLAQKTLAVSRLETMLDLCQKTLARGLTLSNPSALLETFFDQYGLSSVQGLFENLQDDDSVEVYDTTHQLVFANLIAFRAVSFTLEDVYCRPWTDMLSRDTRGVHEALMKVGQEILAGTKNALTSTAFIPDHVCREMNSPEMRSFIVFPNFFAPLYRGRDIAGYVCVNKLFPYVETPPPDEMN